MITIKTDAQLEIMRKAGKIAAETLTMLEEKVKPGITTAEIDRVAEEYILSRDRSKIPGSIRVSFGLYNTIDEIDRLCEMLEVIIKKKYKGRYFLDKERGEYYPEGFRMDFPSVFTI